MNTIKQIVHKIQTSINRRRFENELSNILKTPAITLGTDEFIALSMVHHRDVESYLLAIKSFCHFLHPRKIVMVADPSITDADRDLISRHINGVEIVRAEDFRESGMPQGGCWERLIAISEYAQDDYVIQLDADTVTLDYPTEVRNAVSESCSFVLATEDGQDFISCLEAANWAEKRVEAGEHIQVLAESNLHRLPSAEFSRYVRGCAGFSGFAPNSFSRAKLRTFSQTMSELLSEKWSSWGTEQFASNCMVSNSPKAYVLPHPKYCHPGREKPGTIFLHFIGYVRFSTDRYASAAKNTYLALTT